MAEFFFDYIFCNTLTRTIFGPESGPRWSRMTPNRSQARPREATKMIAKPSTIAPGCSQDPSQADSKMYQKRSPQNPLVCRYLRGGLHDLRKAPAHPHPLEGSWRTDLRQNHVYFCAGEFQINSIFVRATFKSTLFPCGRLSNKPYFRAGNFQINPIFVRALIKTHLFL